MAKINLGRVVPEIVDNLSTDSDEMALSARQGKLINETIEKMMQELKRERYEVGDYLFTDRAEHPNKRFNGVWEQIKGRVIVGVDEKDPMFLAPGKAVGSKTEDMDHCHLQTIGADGTGGAVYVQMANPYGSATKASWRVAWGGQTSTNTVGRYDFTSGSLTTNGADKKSISVIQPSHTTYIWRRIS